MSNYKFYGAVGLIGASDGDLDNLDGTSLAEADGTVLISATRQSGLYSLDATSILTEKSPSTVIPDSGHGGTKVWILTSLLGAGLSLYEADSTNLFQISQSTGDVLIDNTFDTGIITLQGEDAGNKTLAKFDPAGAAELYDAGTKKFETDAAGVTITGNIIISGTVDGIDVATDVAANTTHRGSDGKNHSDVVLNNTHRSSSGVNHSHVVTNDTHVAGDGSDHADVATNTAASHAQSHTVVSHSDTTATGAELNTLTGGGDTILHDHDGISENTTHRGGTGADHSHVTLNTTHRSSNGTNHANVVSNNTHRAGDGSDHADVATNSAARHNQSHTVASHSDTTGTGAELNTLTDGSNADALHVHSGIDIPSGTKMYFYQAAAPVGWTIDNTVTDQLLAFKGGAQAYNVAGGTNGAGTWTQPNHTHTGPSHTHTGTTSVETLVVGGGSYGTGSNTHTHTFTSAASGTGATGGGATANTWRPDAAVGILATKD